MCHINIVFTKDKTNSALIPLYMNAMSYHSFGSNDDGEGYIMYTEGTEEPRVAKSLSKYRFKTPCWFLATHQRYKTVGEGVDNVHPHETKDFLVMHNGVFYDLGDKEKSDSKVFAEKIQEELDKLREEDKNVCPTLAIRNVLNSTAGYYSLLIVDKNTNNIFYAKEYNANMYLVENDKYVVMSTSEDNVKLAKFLFAMDGAKTMTITENYIYDIVKDFKSMRKFEKCYNYKSSYKSCGHSAYGKSYSQGSYTYYKNDKWYNYNDEEVDADGKKIEPAKDESPVKDDRYTDAEGNPISKSKFKKLKKREEKERLKREKMDKKAKDAEMKALEEKARELRERSGIAGAVDAAELPPVSGEITRLDFNNQRHDWYL